MSWAGPELAPAWLDTAREFTARWHHQQQIRDATARQPLHEPALFAPVLATFVHALPRSFNGVAAANDTTVKLTITGDAGGQWVVFVSEADGAADAAVELEADTAWRLFTKGVSPNEARRRAKLAGHLALAGRVLETIAIIG